MNSTSQWTCYDRLRDSFTEAILPTLPLTLDVRGLSAKRGPPTSKAGEVNARDRGTLFTASHRKGAKDRRETHTGLVPGPLQPRASLDTDSEIPRLNYEARDTSHQI
jgi:hypothetical protein